MSLYNLCFTSLSLSWVTAPQTPILRTVRERPFHMLRFGHNTSLRSGQHAHCLCRLFLSLVRAMQSTSHSATHPPEPFTGCLRTRSLNLGSPPSLSVCRAICQVFCLIPTPIYLYLYMYSSPLVFAVLSFMNLNICG